MRKRGGEGNVRGESARKRVCERGNVRGESVRKPLLG